MLLFKVLVDKLINSEVTGAIFSFVELEAGWGFAFLTGRFGRDSNRWFAGPNLVILANISDEFFAIVFQGIQELIVVTVETVGSDPAKAHPVFAGSAGHFQSEFPLGFVASFFFGNLGFVTTL